MATANELIRAARTRLSASMPYLTPALWTVRVEESSDCVSPGSGAPTMGVSENWTLYFHPECAKWPVDALETVWLHEIWHLLRQHAARGRTLGVTPANHVAWNVAADLEINDGLVEQQRPFPPGLIPCTPAGFKLPDHLTAEEYYGKLPTQQQQSVGVGGSGSDGQHRAWEQDGAGGQEQGKDGKSKGAGQPQQGRAIPVELIKKQVAEEMCKARGTMPESWRRWAGATVQVKQVPWEVVFRSVIGRIMSSGKRDDFSFGVPSRRDLPGGFILPGQFGTLPDVAVAVDTSGSMADSQLAEGMEILESVLEYLGRVHPVTVIAGDAAVAATSRVLSKANVDLTGGGGTDMRELITYAQEHVHPRPQVLVLVTDCYTPWPETAPTGLQLVILAVGDGKVPAWAQVIRTNH